MSITMQCDIVSARETIFSGEVKLCVAPGVLGELGITPRHTPLMTTLRPGAVRVLLPDDEEIVFAASGGILEVMPHMVTVLADMAERADHLDAAAATRAKEQAERLLASRTDEMDIEKAQEKLDEAIAQLQALERLRRMTQRKH